MMPAMDIWGSLWFQQMIADGNNTLASWATCAMVGVVAFQCFLYSRQTKILEQSNDISRVILEVQKDTQKIPLEVECYSNRLKVCHQGIKLNVDVVNNIRNYLDGIIKILKRIETGIDREIRKKHSKEALRKARLLVEILHKQQPICDSFFSSWCWFLPKEIRNQYEQIVVFTHGITSELNNFIKDVSQFQSGMDEQGENEWMPDFTQRYCETFGTLIDELEGLYHGLTKAHKIFFLTSEELDELEISK